MSFVPSSFLLLVVRLGAPSSVLAPSSDALVPFVASLLRPHQLAGLGGELSGAERLERRERRVGQGR